MKRAFSDGKLPDVIFFLIKTVDVDSAIDKDLEFLQAITTYINSIRESLNLDPVPVIALLTKCDEMSPSRMVDWDMIFPKTVRINDDPDDLALAQQKNKNIKGAIDKLRKNINSFNLKQKSGKIVLLQDPIPIATNLVFVREILGAPPNKKHSVTFNIDLIQQLILDKTPSSAQYYLVSSMAVGKTPICFSYPYRKNKMQICSCSCTGVTTGVGFVAREAFRQLIKLIPGVGSGVGAVTAWFVTMALGEVAVQFFLKGKIVKFSEMIEKYKKEKSPFQ